MSFFWYVIIGLAAGYAAGKITSGKGFGFWMNLILGIIGGVLGGWVFGLLGIRVADGSIVGNLISSFVGAVILLALAARVMRK